MTRDDEVHALHNEGRHYEAAIKLAHSHLEMSPSVGIEWWIARASARYAAGKILEEARRVGVTENQWESMRKIAAIVAED